MKKRIASDLVIFSFLLVVVARCTRSDRHPAPIQFPNLPSREAAVQNLLAL